MSFDTQKTPLPRSVLQSLNPFRTGQCLSTKLYRMASVGSHRLNPFRTGQCLSTTNEVGFEARNMS